MEKAKGALALMLEVLGRLTPRERARVIHSLLDAEAARPSGGSYQLITNFANDRYLVEKGADSAAEYWRYLASTRTDPRDRDSSLKAAGNWATVK
jgi:hypothetical protein